LIVCWYDERNPLRAGLVTRSEAWNHGSLWDWVKGPKADRRLLSAWPTPRVARLSEACAPCLSRHARLNGSHASERRATMVTCESRTPLRGVRALPFPAC
jgi:hypothetical protein